MSNSLGALGVDVFANTASFESDMGRAARVAERDMKAVERAASMAGKAIAGIAIAAGGTFVVAVQKTIELHSSLDDMADATGDSVQSLDGLRRTAIVAGVEMDRLQSIITRTAKGLDTKSGQSAIAAIGLDVERLRALKPGEAMQEIAQALAKYEDGQGKINAATAIWGRDGAKNLALMKDLAEAGIQQGKITAEMAAQAEKAEKEWRKLKLEFSDFVDTITVGVIPWLGRMIEQMNEGIRIAGGFREALRLFGLSNTTAENVGALRKELEGLTRTRDAYLARGDKGLAGNLEGDIANMTKRLEFAKFLERQEALKKTGPGFEDVRDAMSRRRPQIPGLPAPDEKAGKSSKNEDVVRAWVETAEIATRAAESMVYTWDEAGSRIVMTAEQFKQLGQAAEASAAQAAKALQQDARAWVETAEIATRAAESVVYTWDEAGNRIEIAKEQFEQLEQAAKRTDDTSRELGLSFSSAFEDAVISGKKLSDVVRSLGQDISRIFLRRTVTEPLAKAASDLFSSFDFGKLLGFRAAGGPVSAGAPYVVGERGPELFMPGVSGAIVPNHALGGGARTVIGHIDMRGASMEAVARLEQMLVRVDASIEPRATAAVFEEQLRGNRV